MDIHIYYSKENFAFPKVLRSRTSSRQSCGKILKTLFRFMTTTVCMHKVRYMYRHCFHQILKPVCMPDSVLLIWVFVEMGSCAKALFSLPELNITGYRKVPFVYGCCFLLYHLSDLPVTRTAKKHWYNWFSNFSEALQQHQNSCHNMRLFSMVVAPSHLNYHN